MSYIHRAIEQTVFSYLKTFPILGITGPRQSGKSTLLTTILPDYTYVTFDDHQLVAEFEQDPQGFFQKYNNHVIFDEVQHVPEIFYYLKIAVDNDRSNYGKFAITGSSNFTLTKSISESLAGRIGLLTLLPLQYNEIPDNLRSSAIYKGCYPELIIKNYNESRFWYASYFTTYLMRDVRLLSNIGDLKDFQRFVQLLAANTAQVVNLSNYSKDIGVSVPTIKRWLSVLEASYIIFLLQPYYKNIGKRLIKSPKVYFYDTGLVSHLTGISTFEHYDQGPMAGSLFENFIISEILKQELHSNSFTELYYIRTSNQLEIDLVIDNKRYKKLVEIKKTATLKPSFIKNISLLLEPNDRGLLLYNGKSHIEYKKDIDVVNYAEYLLNILNIE